MTHESSYDEKKNYTIESVGTVKVFTMKYTFGRWLKYCNSFEVEN